MQEEVEATNCRPSMSVGIKYPIGGQWIAMVEVPPYFALPYLLYSFLEAYRQAICYAYWPSSNRLDSYFRALPYHFANQASLVLSFNLQPQSTPRSDLLRRNRTGDSNTISDTAMVLNRLDRV